MCGRTPENGSEGHELCVDAYAASMAPSDEGAPASTVVDLALENPAFAPDERCEATRDPPLQIGAAAQAEPPFKVPIA